MVLTEQPVEAQHHAEEKKSRSDASQSPLVNLLLKAIHVVDQHETCMFEYSLGTRS